MLLFCCPPQTLHESPDWRHLKSDGSHPCSQKADCTDTAFGLNIPAPSKVRTFLAVFTFCPLCLFLVVLPSLDHFNAILIVSATSSCKPETYYFVVTWIFHVMGRISPTLRKIIKAMWDCFLWRWWCFFLMMMMMMMRMMIMTRMIFFWWWWWFCHHFFISGRF